MLVVLAVDKHVLVVERQTVVFDHDNLLHGKPESGMQLVSEFNLPERAVFERYQLAVGRDTGLSDASGLGRRS